MSALSITRGDDEVLDITASVALDTALEIWFTAKRQVEDSDAQAILSKTLSADEIAIDGLDATKATVDIAAADTAALSDRGVTLVWDLQLKNAAGKISTVASGTLEVSADVTRATS